MGLRDLCPRPILPVLQATAQQSLLDPIAIPITYYIDGRTPGIRRLWLPPPIACALCVPALFSLDGEAQLISTITIGKAMVAVSLTHQRFYLGRFEQVQDSCVPPCFWLMVTPKQA